MSRFTKLVVVNLITFVRVVGTILLLTSFNKLGGVTIGIMALCIYATDILDGVLARYWKVSTFFGALLDGVADKLFTIVNFIILYLIVKDIALIPIVIEVLIILVQLIKYKLNVIFYPKFRCKKAKHQTKYSIINDIFVDHYNV